MLRKLMFGVVATLGLMAPLGAVSEAKAQSVRGSIGYHCCYRVFYRDCCCSPWQLYGRYDCMCEARQALWQLRAQGYEAFIR